jgi:hypothetical protein
MYGGCKNIVDYQTDINGRKNKNNEGMNTNPNRVAKVAFSE